ncbi:hypothetical protein HRG_012792 [Hirsutella rhossiliensis]
MYVFWYVDVKEAAHRFDGTVKFDAHQVATWSMREGIELVALLKGALVGEIAGVKDKVPIGNRRLRLVRVGDTDDGDRIRGLDRSKRGPAAVGVLPHLNWANQSVYLLSVRVAACNSAKIDQGPPLMPKSPDDVLPVLHVFLRLPVLRRSSKAASENLSEAWQG